MTARLLILYGSQTGNAQVRQMGPHWHIVQQAAWGHCSTAAVDDRTWQRGSVGRRLPATIDRGWWLWMSTTLHSCLPSVSSSWWRPPPVRHADCEQDAVCRKASIWKVLRVTRQAG